MSSLNWGRPWVLGVLAGVLIGCQSGSSAPSGPDHPGAAGRTADPERIVIAFQRQKNPAEVEKSAQEVGAYLQSKIGIPVEVKAPTTFAASVQALVSGSAQVAYLSSVPYLLAKRDAPVGILLAEERSGKTEYDGIFVVSRSSSIQDLAGLKGKRMAFTSATSMSGYLAPMNQLIEQGLIEENGKPESFFGKVFYAGGYDLALRAVLSGQADVAAVSDYTMEGPTADVYLKPDERKNLRILARVPGVPSHLVAVRTNLSPELRTKIRNALLDLSREKPEALIQVYGATKLVEVDEQAHVRTAEEALRRTGVPLDGLVK